MRKFTDESATRLQEILSKRLGRQLANDELEEAYVSLMDFVFALVDLTPPQQKPTIDNYRHISVQC